MIRKIIFFLITICLIYFIAGFVAVKFEWISSSTYNSYTTLAGGIATICGLYAFTLPKLTTQDIKGVQIESFKELALTADELISKENELNLKQTELTRLDQQKKEMEFLVRKASLSLFLQDQIERNEKRIHHLLSEKENEEMVDLLDQVFKSKKQLNVLNEEIQLSDQVELLNEIINKSRNQHNDIELIALLPSNIIRKAIEILKY
ncbi:hypothetical protein ACORE2_29520 (plasmid) [Bacillus thuringiensis]|uniref:hypothetical protein n=1 Tax=Bacillus thuringiensis TaxID=1428 RepID=UPI003BB14734